MYRFAIAPLISATMLVLAGGAVLAQGAFPNAAPPFGTVPQSGPSKECVDGYAALREETETKSKAIKAASDRRASADEACRLIGDFRTAEAKLFKYAETNVARCAIPAPFMQQLKAGLQRTEALQTKVCTMARDAEADRTTDAGADAWTGRFLADIAEAWHLNGARLRRHARAARISKEEGQGQWCPGKDSNLHGREATGT